MKKILPFVALLLLLTDTVLMAQKSQSALWKIPKETVHLGYPIC